LNSAPNGNEGVYFALGKSERPANFEILPLRPLSLVLLQHHLLPLVIATWKCQYEIPRRQFPKKARERRRHLPSLNPLAEIAMEVLRQDVLGVTGTPPLVLYL